MTRTPYDAEDVIVSRTFTRDDGDVSLVIFKPRPDPSPMDADPAMPPFRCDYAIDFPDCEQLRRHATGIDGVQALLFALNIADVELRYRNGTLRPPIYWLGSEALGLKNPSQD